MNYFSLFSGVGGFELAIQRASNKQLTAIEQDRKRGDGSTDEVEHDVLLTSGTAPLCVGYSEINKYAIQIYEKHFGVCDLSEETQSKPDKKSRENKPLPNRESRTYRGEQSSTNSSICSGDGENSQGNEGTGTSIEGIQATDEGSSSERDTSIINRRPQELHNCKGHKNYGDCKGIKWEDVPGFELLVGGFPCQSFSIAGKRGGFKDTRGTLFFEIARCLKEKQPRLCVLENVKGLLSHDKGATFATILSTLADLNYDVQAQVLNSKNFGVPQNRERVFIIGHLRGTSRPEVFPIGETNKQHIQESKQPETSAFWDDRNKRIRKDCPTLDQPEHNSIRLLQPDKQNTQPEGDKSDSPNSIRRTSYTDGARIRRLTPTECERLQGFPDGWTEGISDTQRYKCLGNAVTVNVVQAIMERM